MGSRRLPCQTHNGPPNGETGRGRNGGEAPRPNPQRAAKRGGPGAAAPHNLPPRGVSAPVGILYRNSTPSFLTSPWRSFSCSWFTSSSVSVLAGS